MATIVILGIISWAWSVYIAYQFGKGAGYEDLVKSIMKYYTKGYVDGLEDAFKSFAEKRKKSKIK